jgi:hypothetical protein
MAHPVDLAPLVVGRHEGELLRRLRGDADEIVRRARRSSGACEELARRWDER